MINDNAAFRYAEFILLIPIPGIRLHFHRKPAFAGTKTEQSENTVIRRNGRREQRRVRPGSRIRFDHGAYGHGQKLHARLLRIGANRLILQSKQRPQPLQQRHKAGAQRTEKFFYVFANPDGAAEACIFCAGSAYAPITRPSAVTYQVPSAGTLTMYFSPSKVVSGTASSLFTSIA